MTPGNPPAISTERLILRRRRESDREPFARLNADREVMGQTGHASPVGQSTTPA